MSKLRQLASSLHLSVTTVSRALDGYPDVSPATRERVRAAAAAAHYRPNAAARSLRTRKAETVAVTLPSETGRVGPPVFFEMLATCGERLAAQGLDLMLLPTVGPEAELALCRRLVEGRRADALIVVRTRRDDARIRLLLESGLPFVAHGRTRLDRHAFVDGDGAAGFRSATERLAALGHRRIAHVTAPQELTFAHLRRSGWKDAMAGLGLDASAEASGAPTEQGGYDAAQSLLRAQAAPTAFLCATDSMALGAMRALRERGLRPGLDAAVVGHDNLPASAFAEPPLSTMEIDAPDIGRELADLVIARIGGADIRDLQRVLPVRQVPRATEGPPP